MRWRWGSLLVWGSCCLTLGAQPTQPLPAYAESAFPTETRPQEAARIGRLLETARSRATRLDERVDSVFGSVDAEAIEKVRIVKRRFLRSRAFDFAARCLAKGDASGLGFAEQSVADVEDLNDALEEELANWAKSPSSPLNPHSPTLTVRDFGAKGDGVADDTSAFARACEAVRALGGRPSVLRIPAGVYRVAGTHTAQCCLAGLENCRIEGDGPTNTFIRGAGYRITQFVLQNCRNCVVRGLDVSLEKAPFVEGVVESFDVKTGACEVRLRPGSLLPTDPGWVPEKWERLSRPCGCAFDERGRILPNTRFLRWVSRQRDSVDLGNGRWRVFFARSDNEWEYDYHTRNLRPGLTLVLPNRSCSCEGFQLQFCTNCTIEDVWVRNSRASAFCTTRSRRTTLHRCRVFPREGLTLASNADGCFCESGTILCDCQFDSMGDDGCNSLTYTTVAEPGDGPFEVRTPDLGPNRGGEIGVFADPLTGQYLANATFAQDDAVARFDGRKLRVSRFTRPVPENVRGLFLYSPRRLGIGTIVSGCTFRNGRLAGTVIQTGCALVENNRYENIKEGVRLGALGDFREGPAPHNVMVSGCTVDGADFGLWTWIRTYDPVKKCEIKPDTLAICGVDAIGNSFSHIATEAIRLRNVCDLSLEGSTFPDRTPPARPKSE